MPFTSHLVGDSKSYWDWAGRIAAGDLIGHEVFYQAPFYSYFLGILRSLFGPSVLAAYLVQAGLGAVGCVVLYLAARALFSRRAGLIAGLMLALYAPAIFADLLIQKETLAVLLTALLCWLIARVLPSVPKQPARSAGLFCLGIGVTLGILSITRENALIWIPLLAIWLLLELRRQRGAALALFASGVLIVLGPVALRNYGIGGELILTTSQLGSNLYIGNGPEADGGYVPMAAGRGNALFERDDATRLAEQAEGRKLTAGEVSTYWQKLTRAEIERRPGRFLSLMARKTLFVWNAYEMPDTQDLYFYQRWSWALRALSAVWHFGVLLPLAAVGVLLTWQRRKTLWIFHALVLSLAAAVVVFLVLARYRLPLAPILMLFAAAGAAEAPFLRGKGLTAALVLAAAVAVFANVQVYPRAPREAMPYYNWGVVLGQEGRTEEAKARYREAVRIWPELAEAHYNLGDLYRRSGQLPEAQAALEAAVRARPNYSEAWNSLGLVLRERGFLRPACEAISKSLEQWPDNGPARRNFELLREAALEAGDGALVAEITRRQAQRRR